MNNNFIDNNVKLKPAEKSAALFLASKGFRIEVIIPSNTPHNKNPDFLINGKIWELKCPTKNRRETLERCFKKAAKQSENLLLDLRNIKGTNKNTLDIIVSRFRYSKSIKQLMIIQNNKLLRYKK